MSSLAGQELKIVSALSIAKLPEHVLSTGNVQHLIDCVVTAQNTAKKASDSLEKARGKKASQNIAENWWNDTDDKINDAQLTLSTSIADLNRHSSQLLIINTAISKVLCDQQDLLLLQQKILEEQADHLQQQNNQIFIQQEELARQQDEISKANKGLLEAKGITAEHAKKLIGCVKSVEAAEERISDVNQQLLIAFTQQLTNLRNELSLSLSSSINALETRDEQLLDRLKDQQQKLSSQTTISWTLEQKIESLLTTIPNQVEGAVTQYMAHTASCINVIEEKLDLTLVAHAKLAGFLKYTVVTSGVAIFASVLLGLQMYLGGH